jgi:SpoVK/Ycf46/Vps4 family AAA+-type ATPase
MQPIRELEQATAFVQTEGVDLSGVRRAGLWAPATGVLARLSARKCSWEDIPKTELARPVATVAHFKASIKKMRPSVDKKYLARYDQWTRDLGESGV